ncbi:MAG: ammonium transporter [Thermoplasmata archaeon]|nr:ammonium transporter [Thermoplasmata archaeon]
MNRKNGIWAVVIICIIVAAVLCYCEAAGIFGLATDISTGSSEAEQLQFSKNLDIWFMLMLVAFLMIFIRKFEWGICLAVLLSAVSSFVVYLAIQDFIFEYGTWDQTLLIKAVICAITVVIAIGVFSGVCKMWQYLFVGVAFAFVYALVEWLLGNVTVAGELATDPGGSILVHMCAAYFGLGVAMAIRDKRAFDEPMYTTTHSVTFVWLASMLLWMLWPSFVTSLLPLESVTQGTITCYMAGVGSIISTYFVCSAVQGKINSLTFTYAMLCGPVAIGAPLLSVGPWGALLIGLIAGAVSALCFIYLQPWFTKKIGTMDIMGVHNLHGVGGWMGAIFVSIIVGSVASIAMAVVVFVVTLVLGYVVGLIVRVTRGEMEAICDDDTDFVRTEAPAEVSAEAPAASEA